MLWLLYRVVLKVNFIFFFRSENRSTRNPVTFYAVNCYRTSRKADHNAGRFHSCHPECRNDHWMCFRWWKTCSYGKWCIDVCSMLYVIFLYCTSTYYCVYKIILESTYIYWRHILFFLFMLDLSIIFRDDKICKHYSYVASIHLSI